MSQTAQHNKPHDQGEPYRQLLELVRSGALIGVEVFGTDDCCEHGPDTDCPSKGYGLCDALAPHSDCNRARKWLLRPSDALMTQELSDLLGIDDS